MQNHALRLLFFLALFYQLLLTGCSTTPSAPPDSQDTAQQLERLYQLARQSQPPVAYRYRLEAAELLIAQHRFEEAAAAINRITPVNLGADLQARYALASTQVALSRFNGETGLALLERYADAILQQPTPVQLRAGQLRARSLALLDRHLDSARERIHLAPLLPEAQRQANETALWQALIQVPAPQLQQASKTTDNPLETGWLDLALVIQEAPHNMDQQLTALKRWQKQWPDHPAATRLPEELAMLERIVTERPTHIALLLPLAGKNAIAGKAIRDGFMTAYYNDLANGTAPPRVSIIDTSASDDFNPLYQQAIQQGADFIIGPLEKAHVHALQTQSALTVPTLALNYGHNENLTDQLFQFGLSAEDEARQVAQKAWQSGHLTSLVLTPGTPWGQRTAAAFAERWKSLGGTVLETAYFGQEKSYSDAIEALLDIDTSHQRARRLRAVLSRQLEFTPRRRQDADFIFLVATPSQARQIKPTLAFHFAGSIPLYATSHIYSGRPAPMLDRDLDGIVFCETPWLLRYQTNPLKRAVDINWPELAQPLGRLFALGVDAYHLFPRIQLLSTESHTRIPGATGLLTLDETGRVVRSLEWARIDNGQVQPQQ